MENTNTQEYETANTDWIVDHPWLSVDIDDEIVYSLDELRFG